LSVSQLIRVRREHRSEVRNKFRDGFGLQMDSPEALFGRPMALGSSRRFMRTLILEVVARDGIEEHYKLLSLPISGIFLNPRLDVERCAA
jgi:hypothetical protein